MIKICKQCNNEFVTDENKRIFCSRLCYINSKTPNTFRNLMLKSKEIIEKYNSGKSSTILAKEYGTYHITILKILEENNIPRRDRSKTGGSQIKNKREMDRINKYTEIVLSLYFNGYSMMQIADEIKICRESVKRLLRDNNVKIRQHDYYQMGSNNTQWKGGDIDFNILYNTTRNNWEKISKNVQKRDDYICQKCGEINKTLHVHHIIPARYADTMAKNDYENLITLCDSCHTKIEPQWYNYVEPFRNYLTKFYGYQNYPVDFYKAMQKAELV